MRKAVYIATHYGMTAIMEIFLFFWRCESKIYMTNDYLTIFEIDLSIPILNDSMRVSM